MRSHKVFYEVALILVLLCVHKPPYQTPTSLLNSPTAVVTAIKAVPYPSKNTTSTGTLAAPLPTVKPMLPEVSELVSDMSIALSQEKWNDQVYKEDIYKRLAKLGPAYASVLTDWRIGIELMSRKRIRMAISTLNPEP